MKTKKILAIVLAFVMVMSTMSFSVFADSNTVTVDSADALADAIENANSGDVINIASGEYDLTGLTESIVIDSEITISGAGKEETKLIFDSATSAFSVCSDNVTIENMTLVQGTEDESFHISIDKGAWDAPKVQYSDITFRNLVLDGSDYSMCVIGENVVIDSCDFKNQDSRAVIVYSLRGDSKIINNTFNTIGKYVIAYEGGTPSVGFATDADLEDFMGSGKLTIDNNKAYNSQLFFGFFNWNYVKDVELYITNNIVDSFTNKGVGLDVTNQTESGNEFSVIKINNNSFTNIKKADGTVRPAIRDHRASSAAVTIDARYNYYGASPDITALVVSDKGDTIEYFPYYTDEDMTEEAVYVAEVGGKKYTSIDEAVANWTNNSTLTLLSDVTLSDVIKLKSTENHTLNLDTYTMSAASNKNAIEITCEGRSSASYALTINADADAPGGIKAKGKACIYYKKTGSVKDRPIITVNNGVFEGSYSINCISNGNTNCPQIDIYNGIFKNNVNLTKCKLRIGGGTFDGWINCTGDSSAYRLIWGGRFKSWQFMTADAPNKFGVGTSLSVYDVGAYVDEDGYLVVGGPVITGEDVKDRGAIVDTYAWSNYLKYSSVAANGLYYEDAATALNKNKSAKYIKLYEEASSDITTKSDLTMDITDAKANYTGTVYLGAEDHTFTLKLPSGQTFDGAVRPAPGCTLLSEEVQDDGSVKYRCVKSKELEVASLDDIYRYQSVQEAVNESRGNGTIKLLKNTTEDVIISSASTAFALNSGIVLDLDGFTINGSVTIADGATATIKNGSIVNTDNSKGAINSSGIISVSSINITSDGAGIVVTDGNAEITGGKFKSAIGFDAVSVAGNAIAEISGGIYSTNVSDYVVDGYDVVRTTNGYVVVSEELQADEISIEYKDITKAGVEGEKTFEIVVKANDGDYINELASADLTFEYTKAPVTGGAISFEVAPADDFSMTRYENSDRYMFNYNGVEKWEGTDSAITIGTIKVTGYGSFTISTKSVDTNVVNATTLIDNLVDSYTAAGATDNDSTTGALIINTDTVTGDNMVGEVKGEDGVIAVPTRTLTINIDFPNAIKANVAAYQEMKVEITGVIDGVNQTVEYDLGETMDNGSYVVENSKLVLNNAYTVTVSGEGYRTTRYTVTMTKDKKLRFWNNVMDEAQVVEIGKGSSEAYVTFLAGDIVKDNVINIYDLSAVVSYFGTPTVTSEKSEYVKYDLNRDGVIDSKDVAYILVSWGK